MHDGSLAAGVTPRYGRKREAIVAAATDILNRRGVKGMTLTLVAEQVGLITTSVTYYFKKKEDLAAACFLSGIDRLQGLVDQAALERTVEARLRVLLDLYLDLRLRICRREEPPIPVFSDIRALEAEHQAPVGQAYGDLFHRVELLFRGAVAPHAPEAGARAHMVLEQLHWLEAWLHRYDPEDYPRVRDRMLDILLHGFAPAGAQWRPQSLAPKMGADDFRETFLVAATRLINQLGYRGASVEKISASLNVTKGSFYHHHQAKDDVVVACFQRAFELLRSLQAAARDLGADEWTKLTSAAAAVVAFQLSDQGPLLRMSALSALPESMRHDMVELSNRISDRWAAMISDGVAEGSVRPVDPFIGAQMLNASMNASADLRALQPGLTADVAASHYARPMLMGLAAT
jgi:AcrR family transcriptional regulator